MTTPEKELINKLSQIVLPDIPDVADEQTNEELTAFEEQHNRLVLREHEQDINLRKDFASKIFWLVICWLVAMLAILVLEGFKIGDFSLSNSVVLALIGSSTLNILGLLYVVTHYLFPKKP